MKNLKTKIVLLTILGMLGIFTFQSCEDETTTEMNKNSTELNEIPKYVYNSYVNDLKLPDGTEVKKIDDSTVEFVYPKGIELWISDESGVFSRMAYSGSYTCTCSGGGGCDVFYVRGSFGCSHGSCSGDCTGSHSRISNVDNIKYFFVDTNQSLEPIINDKDFEELPYLPEMVLKQKDVQNKLKKYALSIYGENFDSSLRRVDNSKVIKSDVNDIVYIQMKMYGFKFIYGISMNDLKPNVLKNNNFERVMYAGDHSCNCDSGSSGCEKGSSLGVKYCEGGSCTECTMTVN